LIHGLFLVAQIAELASPGPRIVGIATTPGQNETDRKGAGYHKVRFSHLSLPEEKNPVIMTAAGPLGAGRIQLTLTMATVA
jgi:hypothetical protein